MPVIRKPAIILLISTLIGCLAVAITATATSGTEATHGGRFYLVSVGCGDADNITLKAMKVIKSSDIIFGDADLKTVYPDLMAEKQILPKPSLKIHKYFQSLKGEFAQGAKIKRKEVSNAAIQGELDRFVRTVTDAVKAGKIVSLLDYGDPCIYGPYIWTMKVLEALDPVIIPGVSSLNAANAALKRGLTFGRAAHSAILTNAAELKAGYNGMDTIERMATTRSSMVVFTMFTRLTPLVERLSRYYPGDTPIAVVINAGYADKERVVRGTLDTIVAIVEKQGALSFAHLIYVGDFLNS
ncbi:CbiF4: predicted cobalt-precorrin-3 methylase [Desulfosarcina variabilis str. Montpellier]|uniref:SAM-dependent methyltransferase n=1 Tax=Desulfosarcina variabilis TaxID=2300 RepID=UPI003AFA19D3